AVYSADSKRGVELDFIISPGADWRAIRFRYPDATKIRVNAKGDLQVNVAGVELQEARPVAYQSINGNQIAVAAPCSAYDNADIGFRLVRYDPRHKVVIDPILAYTAPVGTNPEDMTQIGSDGAQNVYLAGSTYASYPTTAGAFQSK